jgi:hypothetical protein
VRRDVAFIGEIARRRDGITEQLPAVAHA